MVGISSATRPLAFSSSTYSRALLFLAAFAFIFPTPSRELEKHEQNSRLKQESFLHNLQQQQQMHSEPSTTANTRNRNPMQLRVRKHHRSMLYQHTRQFS